MNKQKTESDFQKIISKNKGIIYAFNYDKLQIKGIRELIRRTSVKIIRTFEKDINSVHEF